MAGRKNKHKKIIEAKTREAGETAIDCVAAQTKTAFAQNNPTATFNAYLKGLPEKERGTAIENANNALLLWQSLKTQKNTGS